MLNFFPKTMKRYDAPPDKVRYCKACRRPTKESKPYCKDHVEMQPYVQDLLRTVAIKEKDDAQTIRIGQEKGNLDKVNIYGLTAQEILNYLWIEGPSTVKMLTKRIMGDPRAVSVYVRALEKAGRVTLTRKKRSHIVERVENDG